MENCLPPCQGSKEVNMKSNGSVHLSGRQTGLKNISQSPIFSNGVKSWDRGLKNISQSPTFSNGLKKLRPQSQKYLTMSDF